MFCRARQEQTTEHAVLRGFSYPSFICTLEASTANFTSGGLRTICWHWPAYSWVVLFQACRFLYIYFFLFNICCHSVTKLVQSVLRSLLLLEPVGYSCQCGCNLCAGLRHNALFIAESLLLNDYCRNIYHNKQLNTWRRCSGLIICECIIFFLFYSKHLFCFFLFSFIFY